jgi:cysteine desulfurase
MDPMPPVYLDHAATTPLAPGVLDAMRPFFDQTFANPSASYRQAREARVALDGARATVARVLGAQPAEVVFTSGGTESDNLAIVGVARAMRDAGRGAHLVTVATEHEAVLKTVAWLERREGFAVTVVGVDALGRLDVDALMTAVRPDTVLVSVMLANNEIGTIQPVAEVGARLRGRGVPLHTDAVQAALWLDLDVERLGVDLLSLSGHKYGGPRGTGVLYVREGTAISPLLAGGGQEGGLRSGTANVAGAVGLATALERAARGRDEAVRHVVPLRDRLIAALTVLDGVRLTGDPQHRLPGHVSVVARDAPADLVLLGLDRHGIAASSGSACASGRHEPSHVLTAIGVPADLASGALRFTLAPTSTRDEIERTIACLVELIGAVRASGGA